MSSGLIMEMGVLVLRKTWNSDDQPYIRDGDGKKDLIDMNGDGLPDEVFRNADGPYEIRINNGFGFDSPVYWGEGEGMNIRFEKDGNTIKSLIDMNGDALPDDVRREGAGPYLVRLNTGSGFTKEQLRWGGNGNGFSADHELWAKVENENIIHLDENGKCNKDTN